MRERVREMESPHAFVFPPAFSAHYELCKMQIKEVHFIKLWSFSTPIFFSHVPSVGIKYGKKINSS